MNYSGKINLIANAYFNYSTYVIYDKNYGEVWKADWCPWNGDIGLYRGDFDVYLTSGLYYLKISHRYSGDFGLYNYQMKFSSASESFKETTGGTNNTLETASVISLNKKYNGQIAHNDTSDFYKFELSDSGKINLTTNAYFDYSTYVIYNKNYEEVWKAEWCPWNGETGIYSNNFDISLTLGIYYLKISHRYSGDFGMYNFQVKATSLSTPQITKFENTEKGVKMTWGKVTGAKKYRVFVKNGSSWRKLGDTTGTTWTYKTKNSGKKFVFTVCCISSDGKTSTSAYNSKGWSYTFIGAPTVKTFENTASGVKMTWGKVTGAKKYRVFVKNGSSWRKLGDTTGTTWTYKTKNSGKKFVFTVCCISSDGKTSTSAYNGKGWAYTFISVPKVNTLSNSKNGVIVKFTRPKGASKIRVFRRVTGGKLTKLGDTTAATFVDKTAKNGVSYTYTVRCVSPDGKKFYSGYDKTGKTIKCKR